MEQNHFIESELDKALDGLSAPEPLECSQDFNAKLATRIQKAEHARKRSTLVMSMAFCLLFGLVSMNYWAMKRQPGKAITQSGISEKGFKLLSQEYFSNAFTTGNDIINQ